MNVHLQIDNLLIEASPSLMVFFVHHLCHQENDVLDGLNSELILSCPAIVKVMLVQSIIK